MLPQGTRPPDRNPAATVLDLLDPGLGCDGPTVIHSDAATRFALFRLRPGDELPRHRSRFPTVLQILEGEAEIGVGGRPILARPGLWLRLAAGVEHRVRTTRGARLLLQVLKQG